MRLVRSKEWWITRAKNEGDGMIAAGMLSQEDTKSNAQVQAHCVTCGHPAEVLAFHLQKQEFQQACEVCFDFGVHDGTMELRPLE